MKKVLLLVMLVLAFAFVEAQPASENISSNPEVSTNYFISFENAAHHEAQIQATFTNIKLGETEIIMSRSSPGRYALHEFVKNVYQVVITDSQGNILETNRIDPYSWKVSGHDGTIKLSYTLFANRGGGTYAQIDETHAHLNIPATFMYMPNLANQGMEVTFNVREDLNWKVATQLKHLQGNTYFASDLQYFMDSPTEISDHSTRSFDVDGQTINFVLHHNGAEAELDTYFDKVKKTVLQQKAVFGELPKYDYGAYSFLACYIPNASGDGMEHRNSTILTSTRALADGGLEGNIGTVSHEFFHCWNVERIRPKSLEPFNFEEANMSGELWFAEGFTSYYDDLTLCRAGLINQEAFINGLTGTFNYVWTSPGRQFFNPIEMSYQAPFVDAARSVDPVNRGNTFISYYSYGSMLGLALDLSLREKGLQLDDYMKLVWTTFGKQEKPYTISDLQNTLNSYAGKDFGDAFFNNYIHKSGMPNYKRLFDMVGVTLVQNTAEIGFGAQVRKGVISSYTTIGLSAYNAGLENGDTIIQIGEYVLSDALELDAVLKNFKPKDVTKVVFERFGNRREAKMTFVANPSYSIATMESKGQVLKANQKKARAAWLEAK
ncbi:M61 family metallopeptidase [Lacinutrix sp. WUR7]|uniref:M61 family metallopeptidase n=1 Tax=Lacinutrix sp. WUR7 TaxID=2653681 RepID=UPI001EF12E37|nr:peptidase M61 [Lacinutrix sp. WUR7]